MTTSATNDDEAARWAIRLDNGTLAPAEQQDLEIWLAGDERRHGALLRAEATLAYCDRGRALSETSAAPPNDNEPIRWSRRGIFMGGGTFAGLALIGMTGFFLTRPKSIEIRTALGEIRRVPLPDGSVASVNTASDLTIALADERRDVTLNRGEAWFQVAHDKSRPFIVAAGNIRVRAVGTAFSVRRRGEGADVLVTEGSVEIWVQGQFDAPVQIAAGSQGIIANASSSVAVTPATGPIDRSLSWRTGELALNGESLGDAAEELNRYNARKIVIGSPELRQEPVVGYFRVDQPEAFSRAIGATLGAKVSVENDEIFLSR